MMHLLKFPNEIIQKIIAESIPDDIENLVLGCKQLYEAGSIFLPEYNALRKQFRHVRYERKAVRQVSSAGEPRAAARVLTARSPIDLLKLIAERPIIARYIQFADFRRDSELEWQDVHLRSQPEAMDLGSSGRQGEFESSPLGSLVRQSPYLREAGVSIEKWWNDMTTKTVGHADVLLLTLLPNLLELTPNRRWGELDYIYTYPVEPNQGRQKNSDLLWDVLDVIVRRANDPTIQDASLSKLTIIKPCMAVGYRTRLALSSFVPFLALDSLKEFIGGGCVFLDRGHSGMPFNPRYERYGARLEKVDMVGCVGGHRELAELLSRLPSLKIFRFCFENKGLGCEYDWDVGEFLATVQTHAGDRLEEFSLCMLVDYGEKGTTLSSMKGFKRLKVLELDLSLLVGPAYDPSPTNTATLLDAQKHPVNPAMPRLADLLPDSLERFKLRWESSQASQQKEIAVLRNMFQGFAEERETRLPNLADVTVVCKKIGEQASKPMRNVLEDVAREGASVVHGVTRRRVERVPGRRTTWYLPG